MGFAGLHRAHEACAFVEGGEGGAVTLNELVVYEAFEMVQGEGRVEGE